MSEFHQAGDTPYDQGPIFGVPKDALRARIATLEAENKLLREALPNCAKHFTASPTRDRLHMMQRRETMTEHRSFPEAADGRPALPMEPELWAAGCDLETARFVARQLDAQGYTLIRAEDIGWPEIRAFQEQLRIGQCVREDGGGFLARCIMALFRRKPDPVETYQQAAERLLREATQ